MGDSQIIQLSPFPQQAATHMLTKKASWQKTIKYWEQEICNQTETTEKAQAYLVNLVNKIFLLETDTSDDKIYH